MVKEELVNLITKCIKEQFKNYSIGESDGHPHLIPIGISNRHVHLSQVDLEILFGSGYQLTPSKELQPGQYAAVETVNLVGPKGYLKGVRVLGPVRDRTQVEISRTDSFVLGVDPPVRDSGFLQGSASIVLVGPAGCQKINEGVICAARHIHFHTSDAQTMGVKDGDKLTVCVGGERELVFNKVLARVSEKYRLEMHIDTDEANAAGLKNGDTGELYGREGVDCYGC